MDVSIIIVNYNTKNLLRNCLESIFEYTQGISFEVIVSDNGSSDGSVEMVKSDFPQIILIENNANLGFGTANNRGLDIANGKYIFYLNSDTVLLNNAVKIFFDYWETSDEKESIGALGCNLLDANKNINDSYGNFFDINRTIIELLKANYGLWKIVFLQLFGYKYCNHVKKKISEKKLGEVDCIIGADLFLANTPLARFDEHIFLYHEEMDLEYRLMKYNKKRLLIDGPLIIHFEGQSSRSSVVFCIDEIESFSAKCKNISRIYYFKKNISRSKALIVKILTVFLWINPLVIKSTYKTLPQLIRR
ncbi:glycosyltransferase family 2 protein [Treponema brennaborense]|uniref:Glycosyl transferase family 2 n=1 Tax=Treponema brennaborense (strain DSM 12168 / CIP 105900 / DD5/3) TaxID=906968 RepID=F4LMH4_TREBD|nr:glycosyltransferase [Treponema brennaborense]AEE15736.1 glycosyl transferase family 2 [Treponema brennaborense DSM 12168]